MSQKTLKVNDEVKTYAPDGFPATLAELVASLGIDANTVVAEVNGEIVRRDDFAATALDDGADVVLVELVGGG